MAPLTTGNTLPNRVRLTVLRVVWLAVAILVLILLLAALPARFEQLSTAPWTAATKTGQLLPAEARALEEIGLSVGMYGSYFTLLEAASALALWVMGAVVFWHRSDDWMAVFVSITLLSFGPVASPLLQALALSHPFWEFPVAATRAIGLSTIVITFFLFPDGRFVPRGTRYLGLIWVGYVLAGLLVPPLRTPSSLVWETTTEMALFVWAIGWLCAIAVAQIYRYHFASNTLQRQQTKWVVYGLATAVGAGVASTVPLVLFPALREVGVSNLLYRLLAFTLILLAEIFFAVTIAISILRHRLYDIDLVIRRTLLYGALSGTLAVLYLACVLLLQLLFRAATGQVNAPIVTVISTLAIAVAFTPLRQRIQVDIDRRFFRPKYDAARTLAAFAATARDEVDLEPLTDALLAAVQETVQPAHVSLWLKTTQESGSTTPDGAGNRRHQLVTDR